MCEPAAIAQRLQEFGVGRRRLEDEALGGHGAPARLAVLAQDGDWSPPGWVQRPVCGRCRRAPPSPRLLDLHVQEAHDSYFAVLAARAPAYRCYVRECPDKFATAADRLTHGVEVHGLPKDFRFDVRSGGIDESKRGSESRGAPVPMDVDGATGSGGRRQPTTFSFHNAKRKGLIKYSGKKLASDKNGDSPSTIGVDQIMMGLDRNLPKIS